mmetsp:Transcript_22910/g.35230  ORF Transcript_22910/g.35230 Transcript_22910/m.35230 type:complete len:280 (-) Transcript_22910:91-930(-)
MSENTPEDLSSYEEEGENESQEEQQQPDSRFLHNFSEGESQDEDELPQPAAEKEDSQEEVLEKKKEVIPNAELAAKLQKKLKKQTKNLDKAGVVYLSRVPPYMNPTSLRRLMEGKFDGVARIYMELEKESRRRDRVKAGGNRKSKFTEAWVEFEEKSTAKQCAMILNNQQIGGKKRHNMFYDDIWNVKYLSKFKWSHLTEKLTYDSKMREQRLKASVHQAKKEYQFFEDKRSLARKLTKIEAKRGKDLEKLENKTAANDEEATEIEKKKQKNLAKMFKY